MSAAIDSSKIGSLVTYIVPRCPLRVLVRVRDVRRVYGHVQYLITPCQGSGEMWIATTSILESDQHQ